jgi:hypothetical protein
MSASFSGLNQQIFRGLEQRPDHAMSVPDGEEISGFDVMTVAALLSAQSPVPGSDGSIPLAALLPVAGVTVIERQAQMAQSVGAELAMIAVDSVPAALAAALDRMRSQGMKVHLIRSGQDVLAAADGWDALILVADGLIAPKATWSAIAQSTGPLLLSVPDVPATAALERIDATARWAGLAVLPVATLSVLEGLPDDWDPQLALLRGAIQEDTPAILCEPQLFERGDLTLVQSLKAAELVELRMLAQDTGDTVGLVHSAILLPAARALARPLLRMRHSGALARAVQAAGSAGSVAAMLVLHPGLAILLALLAACSRAIAMAINVFRPESRNWAVIGSLSELASLAGLLAAGWILGMGGASAWLSLTVMMVLIERLAILLCMRGAANNILVPDAALLWLALGCGQAFGALHIAVALAAPMSALLLIVAMWRPEMPNSV